MDPHLRTAALTGDLAALSRALDNGADPNLSDSDGYNPLIFAVCNNNTDCVAKLIEAGVPVIFREAKGNIHGFCNLAKAIPSSQGDIAGCLTALRAVITEAEGERVMEQAAEAAE